MTAGDFGVFLLRLLIIEYARDTVDLISIMYSQTRAYFNLHTQVCRHTDSPKTQIENETWGFQRFHCLSKRNWIKSSSKKIDGIDKVNRNESRRDFEEPSLKDLHPIRSCGQ